MGCSNTKFPTTAAADNSSPITNLLNMGSSIEPPKELMEGGEKFLNQAADTMNQASDALADTMNQASDAVTDTMNQASDALADTLNQAADALDHTSEMVRKCPIIGEHLEGTEGSKSESPVPDNIETEESTKPDEEENPSGAPDESNEQDGMNESNEQDDMNESNEQADMNETNEPTIECIAVCPVQESPEINEVSETDNNEHEDTLILETDDSEDKQESDCTQEMVIECTN